MTRFVLSVISDTHQILTTTQKMSPEAGKQINAAYEHWKRQGGVMIITDCLVIDRHGVEIELDLTMSAAEARHERLLNGEPASLGGEAGNVPPPTPPPDRG